MKNGGNEYNILQNVSSVTGFYLLFIFLNWSQLDRKNLNFFSMPFKIRFNSITLNSFPSVFQWQRMTLFITIRFIFTFSYKGQIGFELLQLQGNVCNYLS